MSEAETLSPRTLALLEQFPGPVAIYRSALSRAFFAFAGVLFLVVGLSPLLLFRNASWGAFLSGAVLALPFFALVGFSLSGAFFRGFLRLTLDQEGFDFDIFVWKRKYFWMEAADFASFGGVWYFRNPTVRKNSRRIRDSWLMTGRLIPNHFDLPAKELAPLMNAWRERALSPWNRGA